MRTVVLEDLILLTPNEPGTTVGALLVRNALEPLVTAEALEHSDPADLDELGALLAEMEAHAAEPPAFLSANWALHRRLARIAHNPVLARAYEETLDVAEAQVEAVVAGRHFSASVARTLAVHRELLTAIADREPAAVADATARHAPVVRELT